MAVVALATVVMMLVITLSVRGLMIVTVGHLWPTAITVHFTAE
jgi:hypothetical protein